MATFEILADNCIIKNANKPHLFGAIEPNNYESYPKNPHIAKFFVQMARAEELGTGIRNVFKYSQLYSGNVPKVDEGDVFEVRIPLIITKETTKETTKELSDRESLIISLITSNKQVSAVELARSIALSADGVRYYLKKLKNKGILHRKGSTKGGEWIVLKKKLK